MVSRDGDDFPEMIADWYTNHAYEFLGLSDHNIFSDSFAIHIYESTRKARRDEGHIML